MKNLLIILGVFIISNVFSQAKIEALEMVYNFDTVANGAAVVHDFKFINIGDEPLIISRAYTGCGCDAVNYPRELILTGDTATIIYKYDSKREGPINKHFTVISNAVNFPRLVVRNKGYVLPR